MSMKWPDPTLLTYNLDDSANQQKLALSRPVFVTRHPVEQSAAQTPEDIKSILKGHQVTSNDPIPTFQFEYIVVGGGAAGLALASRLAEDLDSNQYVCVIEAGTYRADALVDVPGAYGVALGDKDYDWSYQTVPQKHLNGRQVNSSAGRLLGGSSGINFLVRMCASSPEYDAWNKFGTGWGWKGLLPYFKAEEKYEAYVRNVDQIFPGITEEEDKEARQKESEFRGHSGPVHSTHNNLYTDLLKPTIETTLKVGIKTNRSPGYGDSTGMFNIDTAVNRKQGIRSYAANAYLKNPESNSPQPNVVVLKGVYASRILFDPVHPTQDVKAVGLTCIGGVDWNLPAAPVFPFDLKVNKEMVVSAGSYNTPRLLELSGIGNPEILSKFNINPIVNLPAVGENLQEHPYVVSDFVVKQGVFTFDRLRNDPQYKAEQEEEYCTKGTGVYATTISAYGFIKLENFLSTEEVNELKKELDGEISQTSNPLHKKQLVIQRRYLDHNGVGNMELIMVPKVFASKPKENTSYISLMVCLPHPVARGSAHISSHDSLAPPSIDPQYLNNKYDVKILTKATQFVHKLSETAPLKDIIVAPSTPGPEVQTYEDFEKFVSNRVSSMQHPIGTATMAPKSLGGVVDSELRVYGTQNVRVVDASIAPVHLAAHFLDTAYAIGEKGAEMIKATRKAEVW